MWKIHDRLSGTGKFHSNRLSGVLRVEMIVLDDFRFTVAIRTDQYTSIDMISFIICFIKPD